MDPGAGLLRNVDLLGFPTPSPGPAFHHWAVFDGPGAQKRLSGGRYRVNKRRVTEDCRKRALKEPFRAAKGALSGP